MQRFLSAWAVLAVLAATTVMALAPSPRSAHACSIVTPGDHDFGGWVQRSPIVAIGRWESVNEREVTFVVEQPLKGAEAGDRLPVDNRTTYTAMACSPYDEPFREGHRFVPGEHAVLLLEKEVDGLWQVAYLSLAAFEVPESLDVGMEGVGWYFGDPEAGTPTDVKLSTIIAAAGYAGTVVLQAGGQATPSTTIVPSGPGWTAPPVLARQASDDSLGKVEWLGLALGALLIAAPIAWRWRVRVVRLLGH